MNFRTKNRVRQQCDSIQHPIIHDNFIKLGFYSFLIPVDFAAEMMLINNCKKMLIEMQWRMLTGFQNRLLFLRYYSPGIWVAARRQRPLHALENAKAIRYTLSENAKTGRLPENFASLIHQGVSYYTKKLRHF